MTCLAPYQEVLFGSIKKNKQKKTVAADSLLQAKKADDLY